EPSHQAALNPSSSNPDPFGYISTDSNDGSGPIYNWIEIAPPAGGTGTEITQLSGVDDGYFWPAILPFSFNFYGTDYTQLAIASNGTIYFENNYLGNVNNSIPGATYYGVDTFIAPFWDDLFIAPGAIYYQQFDSGVIIEYYQVSRLGAAGYGTWQVILFNDGNILFQYQDVNFEDSFYDQGQSAAVGIQGDAATGVQYSFYAPALADELAICFAFPGQTTDCSPSDVSWLSVTPESGILAPNSTQEIALTFEASASAITRPGVYTAELRVKEDTPYETPSLLVTMTITPSGVILSPTTETKSGQPGGSVAYTLQITNTLELTDTYELNVGSHNWPIVAPLTEASNLAKLIIGPVAFGQSATVELMVMIPADAGLGATDTATISVTSQRYPDLSANASLITTVGSSQTGSFKTLFLPLIMK
ncbi:MAG: hypothetical protein KDI79_22740, partial [Anaerolineae bacterium]|nr:hypothetical protein [Anaerolineae bacterium]